MKKYKDENKIILKQWVRVFLLIIVIAVAVFSIVSIFKAANPKTADKKKLYSYSYNSGMDYKVYLKTNDFFNVPYMDMNKQYIATIIDHIEVTPKYVFQSTEDLDYIYNYSIVATARGLGEDSDGRKVDVWSKEYPISTIQTQSGSGKDFTISKTVNIDYNAFNQVLSDFRNQFGISVDARVDLTMKITINAGLKGQAEKTLQEAYEMSLQMPLLVQMLRIKADYVNTGGNTVYSKVDPNVKVNVPVIAAWFIVLIGALVVFIKLGKSLLVITRKSEYVLAINKIMKEYGDIIAETHNMPDLAKYDIVNIKSFVDMVDIEEELHSPIIYYEIEENAKCVFLILNDKTAYRFLLRESDFDHFNNYDYSEKEQTFI
ncbi:MAG: DUF5305 domain-containing protein [Bacilli bacterium]|nr:DUF5305 domain-containing protein [Bacilli bacterium]